MPFDEMSGYGEGIRARYIAIAEWLGTQPIAALESKKGRGRGPIPPLENCVRGLR